MKTNKLALASITGMMALIPNAYAVDVNNDGNAKSVGHVTWHMQADVSAQELINQSVPSLNTSLFFIRPNDADTEQTSANIAVNDRFQVSLQPGSYTQVYSCTGINRISAEATGLKTNDLLLDTSNYELAGGAAYFFYVDVDGRGNSSIQQITEQDALEQLQGKLYQAHQVTRVVPNCPVVATPPAPKPPVVIPIIKPEPIPLPAPVLEEPVSIELEVLFDNDKYMIKPQYVSEIQEVADFMKQYPNTTAVIEGHTDSNASVSYNQTLSERRANAIKNMLVSRFGISPDRLSSVGYSELRPRATNATPEGRALNRRVIAIIEERK